MTTQTPRRPVSSDTARFSFYDIESLSNVFTLCIYTPEPDSSADTLEMFYLADDDTVSDEVDEMTLSHTVTTANPGLPEVQTTVWNLRDEVANRRLAEIVGLSSAEHVCNQRWDSIYDTKFRPVCDTDNDYRPHKHSFIAGYNSMNYDTVMLALYLMETRVGRTDRTFKATTAAGMRDHNDKLFTEHIDFMPGYLDWDGPAHRIRRNMLQSGRHLDVARLNELQFKTSLKRLLGMLGYQIKESEKLSHDTSITSVDELYELLAYNVSDCLGLSQLFEHPAYSSNFDLKAGLLAQYDQTVYHQNGSVRKDRLTIDSSSAKFVGRILAPYKPLGDIEAVSFEYPHPDIAAERRARGEEVHTVNVLDQCRAFFEANVAPDPETHPEVTPAQRRAHAQFMQVVNYYKSIEGRNFNDSSEYAEQFKDTAKQAQTLKDRQKLPNNVPYFNADASPSACFATFSTGGIHGAEADMQVFRTESHEHLDQAIMLQQARLTFPDARDFIAEAKRQHNLLTLPDGGTVDKRQVLLGSDPEKVRYRKPKKDDPDQAAQLRAAQEQVPDPAQLLATQRPADQALNVVVDDGTVLEGKTVLTNTTASKAAYRDEPPKKAPTLFTDKTDGSTKLHPRFARTSAGLVIHEDFTSYYPNLLRNMRAFYNPELGEDRYATIFFEKERLGEQMKRPDISAEEKARLKTLRNGTKLILNSASGAGDASHKTPIRMNNRIISMRILGQLFSWRIGQAQTLAGARIISTNTDGLYSVIGGENGFDEATNNAVLAEQQKEIGVEIEPEPMFLISKDSNNRLEIEAPRDGRTLADSPVITASGGTLACYGGPTPTKSLAHPAVIDFALTRYLQTVAGRGEHALAEPFDEDLGRKVIEEAVDPDDLLQTLRLFQNVIAASRGSITYPFAADPIGDDDSTVTSNGEIIVPNPRPLQMVNRVFVVREGTEGAMSLHNAGAWKVNPASQAKRRESGTSAVRRNRIARRILRHHGWVDTRADAMSSDGLAQLPIDQDVEIRRINGIDPSWSMLVVNDDLSALPIAQVSRIIQSLNLEVYTRMLEETFTKNWRNAS